MSEGGGGIGRGISQTVSGFLGLLLGLVIALAAVAFAAWTTWIAFAGGRMPVVGWQFGGINLLRGFVWMVFAVPLIYGVVRAAVVVVLALASVPSLAAEKLRSRGRPKIVPHQAPAADAEKLVGDINAVVEPPSKHLAPSDVGISEGEGLAHRLEVEDQSPPREGEREETHQEQEWNWDHPVDRKSKVVAVMTARGSAGKTVTATSLAVLLAQRSEIPRVCLVDADLQFGDVCSALGLKPSLTVVDAAAQLGQLDEAMLESVLIEHPAGFQVLAAPFEPAFADRVTPAAMTEIITRLARMFDYIIIDTATQLDDLSLHLLRLAHQVLFIVDMEYDPAGVLNAKLHVKNLREMGYPLTRLHLVLNHSRRVSRKTKARIRQMLELRVAVAIPVDDKLKIPFEEGVPPVQTDPTSAASRAFERVAQLVADAF